MFKNHRLVFESRRIFAVIMAVLVLAGEYWQDIKHKQTDTPS
ncbi:MAG: hypothetical protein V3V61_03740 [Gammaproteobacteria bacterium]